MRGRVKFFLEAIGGVVKVLSPCFCGQDSGWMLYAWRQGWGCSGHRENNDGEYVQLLTFGHLPALATHVLSFL